MNPGIFPHLAAAALADASDVAALFDEDSLLAAPWLPPIPPASSTLHSSAHTTM